MRLIDMEGNDSKRIPWNPHWVLPIVNHHKISERRFPVPRVVLERYIGVTLSPPRPSSLEMGGFHESY